MTAEAAYANAKGFIDKRVQNLLGVLRQSIIEIDKLIEEDGITGDVKVLVDTLFKVLSKKFSLEDFHMKDVATISLTLLFQTLWPVLSDPQAHYIEADDVDTVKLKDNFKIIGDTL